MNTDYQIGFGADEPLPDPNDDVTPNKIVFENYLCD